MPTTWRLPLRNGMMYFSSNTENRDILIELQNNSTTLYFEDNLEDTAMQYSYDSEQAIFDRISLQIASQSEIWPQKSIMPSIVKHHSWNNGGYGEQSSLRIRLKKLPDFRRESCHERQSELEISSHCLQKNLRKPTASAV